MEGYFFFLFLKREISFTQDSETLYLNTNRSAKNIKCFKAYIIRTLKMLRIPKISDLMKHTDEQGFNMTSLSDRNSSAI